MMQRTGTIMAMNKSVGWCFLLGMMVAVGAAAQSGPDAASESSRMREIKTTPAGARVFLNWSLLGETPLVLNDEALPEGSLLVVHKPEYRASFRRITAPRSFYLRLPSATDLPLERMLLRLVGPGSEVIEGELVERLAAEDFYIHPSLDVELLEQHLLEIGGRDKEPLYAWARARFATRLWALIYFPGTDPRLDVSRALGFAEPAIGESAAAGEPAAVVVLDVLDLLDGTRRHRVELDGTGLNARGPRARVRAQNRLIEALVASLQEWRQTESEPDDLLLVIDAEAGESDGDQETESGAVAPTAGGEGAS